MNFEIKNKTFMFRHKTIDYYSVTLETLETEILDMSYDMIIFYKGYFEHLDFISFKDEIVYYKSNHYDELNIDKLYILFDKFLIDKFKDYYEKNILLKNKIKRIKN